MDGAPLGLAALVAVIAGGMFLTRSLARLAFPWRRQMFEIAVDMLQRPDLNRHDRVFLNYCLDTALSFKAGWMPLRALWKVLMADLAGHELPSDAAPKRSEDITRVGQRYIASVLIANPVALVLMVPLVIVVMIVGREAPRPTIRHAAVNLRYSTC